MRENLKFFVAFLDIVSFSFLDHNFQSKKPSTQVSLPIEITYL